MDKCQTFRDCRTTIPLSSLKVSNLYSTPCGLMDLQMLKIRCVNYACFPNSLTYNKTVTIAITMK